MSAATSRVLLRSTVVAAALGLCIVSSTTAPPEQNDHRRSRISGSGTTNASSFLDFVATDEDIAPVTTPSSTSHHFDVVEISNTFVSQRIEYLLSVALFRSDLEENEALDREIDAALTRLARPGDSDEEWAQRLAKDLAKFRD